MHNNIMEERKKREKELEAAELQWKQEETLNEAAKAKLEELLARRRELLGDRDPLTLQHFHTNINLHRSIE